MADLPGKSHAGNTETCPREKRSPSLHLMGLPVAGPALDAGRWPNERRVLAESVRRSRSGLRDHRQAHRRAIGCLDAGWIEPIPSRERTCRTDFARVTCRIFPRALPQNEWPPRPSVNDFTAAPACVATSSEHFVRCYPVWQAARHGVADDLPPRAGAISARICQSTATVPRRGPHSSGNTEPSPEQSWRIGVFAIRPTDRSKASFSSPNQTGGDLRWTASTGPSDYRSRTSAAHPRDSQDPESGKTLIFIANNFSLPADHSARSTKDAGRWNSSSRRIKQHLRTVKQFYGTVGVR